MKIYFQKVTEPGRAACNTSVVEWHILHGWCYNVWDCSDDGKQGRIIGVFYVTLLCGLGGILHFDTVADDIPGSHFRAAFRKAIRIVQPYLGLILTTIPRDKGKLIRTVEHLGFVPVPLPVPFLFAEAAYLLLQYLPRRKPIV